MHRAGAAGADWANGGTIIIIGETAAAANADNDAGTVDTADITVAPAVAANTKNNAGAAAIIVASAAATVMMPEEEEEGTANENNDRLRDNEATLDPPLPIR